MEKDKPSKTSEAAAVHRAVHQLLDDEPKILLDPIALRLVEMPKDIDPNVEASKPVFKQLRELAPAAGPKVAGPIKPPVGAMEIPLYSAWFRLIPPDQTICPGTAVEIDLQQRALSASELDSLRVW